MVKGAKKSLLKENLIYIEAILYSLVIILSVYLSLYGIFIIKIVPILFIVGLIGRLIFDRPISISFFGMAASLVMIQILGGYTFKYNIFYSLYTFMCLLVGALSGRYIMNILHSHAQRVTAKVAHNISFAILTIFIGIFFNVYMNGDIVSYVKAKNVLNDYISKTYPEESEKFKIVKTTYLSGDLNYYSFALSNTEFGNFKMGVYLNGKIVDGYLDSKLKTMNDALSSKFLYKYGKNIKSDANVSIYYTDISEDLTLKYIKYVEIENEQEAIDTYIEEVKQFLTEIKDFEKFQQINNLVMQIKSDSAVLYGILYKDEFFETSKYKEKFNVEFFEQ